MVCHRGHKMLDRWHFAPFPVLFEIDLILKFDFLKVGTMGGGFDEQIQFFRQSKIMAHSKERKNAVTTMFEFRLSTSNLL